MSYEGISIRDALDKINQNNGGWFLPQVQRQYVWGERDESEEYICLLLDSILKGYPIGSLVLWSTDSPIPHREFLTDYSNGMRAKEVDKGLWGRSKSLVYDGQQRLQTLFSVLRYTVNGRILCFDLLFDKNLFDTDDTGFYFTDKGKELKPGAIRMNELCSKDDNTSEKVKLRDLVSKNANYSEDEKILIESNLDGLWEKFVQSNTKSISFFPVKSKDDKDVNEVFRRLNTGGVALTQTELVLSKIKQKQEYSLYENRLDDLSDEILSKSGGIEFGSTELLQLIFLMIYGTPRVDSDRVKDTDIIKFDEELINLIDPLKEFFSGYLLGLFNINDIGIIPRVLALFPIITYFADRYKSDNSFRVRKLTNSDLEPINQYFILSQINDWNTQTMVTNFVKLARKAGISKDKFPLEDIRQIASEKRVGNLRTQAFINYPWFALKVLLPNRKYVFSSTKPQIDHIFPRNLIGRNQEYKKNVDILWNFQPVAAEVNNYKTNKHPHSFFNSQEGQKYYQDYDLMPEINSPIWDDADNFIEWRKSKMIETMKTKYAIILEDFQP